MKIGLRTHHAVCVPVNPPLINFRMPEPFFMKPGMYVMAPEPILMEYFINLCMYVYHPIIASQRFSKNVTAAMNTHATIEELLDASFSMRLVSFQRKVGNCFFPELLVYIFINITD
jgi:hypothetical protein